MKRAVKLFSHKLYIQLCFEICENEYLLIAANVFDTHECLH